MKTEIEYSSAYVDDTPCR